MTSGPVHVIGAGPAGLMAALTAGRAGKRVILADEDFRLGGRLNAETHAVGQGAGAAWAAAARRRAGSSNAWGSADESDGVTDCADKS